MKKYEKVLLTVFGGCIVFIAAAVLYRWLELGIVPDYYDNFSVMMALLLISIFGIIAILVSWRIRKRVEAGKVPVSKLYTWSFILSFVPFVWLVIYSFYGMKDGFTFMSSTTYGGEAFYEYFVWYGVVIFGALIPVFPFLVFWQILYIIKRGQYRKLMRARS